MRRGIAIDNCPATSGCWAYYSVESRSYTDGRDDSTASTNAEDNHRISTTWYVRYGCDAVAPPLSGLSNLLPKINVEQVEEVQLVRYAGSGQGFGWHEDALEKDVATSKNGGQRIATLLVYLNECDGGRTLFRDLVGDENARLGVEPKQGRALLFFHLLRAARRWETPLLSLILAPHLEESCSTRHAQIVAQYMLESPLTGRLEGERNILHSYGFMGRNILPLCLVEG